MKVRGDFLIREIKEEDNLEIQRILSSVMREFDVPETGTALADPELENMYQSYNVLKS